MGGADRLCHSETRRDNLDDAAASAAGIQIMPWHIEARQKYSPERLEAASTRAIHIKAYSYKSIKSMLETGFDRTPIPEQKEVAPPVYHDNIRGREYFN